MLSDSILKGMRIVEASAFVAAPLGGMTLAQMGAEVIRIDPLAGGLDYRRWPVTADNRSLFWCGLNKSKKSVTLDLASAEGRELAAALVTAPGPDAGILLTNFPPRGFLDHDALRARRTDLIQLTIAGDRHGRSAVDYTVNPRLGIPYLTGGGTADEVCNHLLPAWDLVTGNLAALGILAAERTRRQNGKGQHVKLALEDAALAAMGHLGFIAEAQLGHQRERAGNDLFGAFGRDFITADERRIMIIGLTAKQWKSLCVATGLTDSIEALGRSLDLDLNREGNRFIARAQLATLFAQWIGARTLADVASAFDAHAVCWSAYQTVHELVTNDPECSVANPLFSRVAQPGVGEVLAPGLPLEFSAFERAPARPAPCLGADTEQVLTDVLGLSSAQFGALIDRKIAGRPSS
jgi:2-methylfumaryl-CoA isomerase